LSEIEAYQKSRAAYVGSDGKFLLDLNTDTIKFVLQNMTGKPRQPYVIEA
jgi:hypothetical protein